MPSNCPHCGKALIQYYTIEGCNHGEYEDQEEALEDAFDSWFMEGENILDSIKKNSPVRINGFYADGNFLTIVLEAEEVERILRNRCPGWFEEDGV